MNDEEYEVVDHMAVKSIVSDEIAELIRQRHGVLYS
jgi:hypothetical protein